MRGTFIRFPGAVVLFVIMAGCGASPQIHFYTLSSSPSLIDVDRDQSSANLSIGIRPITVPLAVDRPQFVLRTGPNRVVLAEEHRWAGSLRNEIQRVIAENLSQLLDAKRVYSYPQSLSQIADISVFVDVQRFDSAPGETATIDALWTVRRGVNTLRSGRVLAKETVNTTSYEEMAAAHSRALLTISREIASSIRAAAPTDATASAPSP